MPIHWSLELWCEDCHAVIRYQDEVPGWQWTEPVPLPTPEERAAAEAWIAEHKGAMPRSLFGRDPGQPRYASFNLLSGWYVNLPSQERQRYATCPACEGRAWPVEDAATEDAGVRQAS